MLQLSSKHNYIQRQHIVVRGQSITQIKHATQTGTANFVQTNNSINFGPECF